MCKGYVTYYTVYKNSVKGKFLTNWPRNVFQEQQPLFYMVTELMEERYSLGIKKFMCQSRIYLHRVIKYNCIYIFYLS